MWMGVGEEQYEWLEFRILSGQRWVVIDVLVW